MQNHITVSAACMFNERGQILLVRKRGTSKFMQPGGKPEPGELPLETVLREIKEELGLDLAPERLQYHGQWTGDAANEAQTALLAHLFSLRHDGVLEPHAELEEILWIDPALAMQREDLAPLLREKVLPDALAGRFNEALSR